MAKSKYDQYTKSVVEDGIIYRKCIHCPFKIKDVVSGSTSSLRHHFRSYHPAIFSQIIESERTRQNNIKPKLRTLPRDVSSGEPNFSQSAPSDPPTPTPSNTDATATTSCHLFLSGDLETRTFQIPSKPNKSMQTLKVRCDLCGVYGTNLLLFPARYVERAVFLLGLVRCSKIKLDLANFLLDSDLGDNARLQSRYVCGNHYKESLQYFLFNTITKSALPAVIVWTVEVDAEVLGLGNVASITNHDIRCMNTLRSYGRQTQLGWICGINYMAVQVKAFEMSNSSSSSISIDSQLLSSGTGNTIANAISQIFDENGATSDSKEDHIKPEDVNDFILAEILKRKDIFIKISDSRDSEVNEVRRRAWSKIKEAVQLKFNKSMSVQEIRSVWITQHRKVWDIMNKLKRDDVSTVEGVPVEKAFVIDNLTENEIELFNVLAANEGLEVVDSEFSDLKEQAPNEIEMYGDSEQQPIPSTSTDVRIFSCSAPATMRECSVCHQLRNSQQLHRFPRRRERALLWAKCLKWEKEFLEYTESRAWTSMRICEDHFSKVSSYANGRLRLSVLPEPYVRTEKQEPAEEEEESDRIVTGDGVDAARSRLSLSLRKRKHGESPPPTLVSCAPIAKPHQPQRHDTCLCCQQMLRDHKKLIAEQRAFFKKQNMLIDNLLLLIDNMNNRMDGQGQDQRTSRSRSPSEPPPLNAETLLNMLHSA